MRTIDKALAATVVAAVTFRALVGCAALQALPQTADAEAQVACVAEAGTRAEGLACICAVRARNPAGPQCDAGADAAADH